MIYKMGYLIQFVPTCTKFPKIYYVDFRMHLKTAKLLSDIFYI